MASVDCRREWNASLIASWLHAEPIDILEELDSDHTWGRPLSVDGISEGSSREKRYQLFNDSEPWRHGEVVRHIQLMIYDTLGECIGFSEGCLLQLPDTEPKLCRICFAGEEEGELLKASCACRGGLKYVHTDCLRLQYKDAGNKICDLCHQSFLGGKIAACMGELFKEKAVRAHGDRQSFTAGIQSATCMWEAGNLEGAAALFKQVIEGVQGLDDSTYDNLLFSAQHNLGLVYIAEKKYEQAYRYIHQARLGFTNMLGDGHAYVMKARHNEAMCKQEQAKYCEAIALYTPLLEDRQKALGAEHADTLKTALNLGLSLYQTGRNGEAESLLRPTMRSLERLQGRQHAITLCCMMNLALTLSRLPNMQNREESIHLAQEAADNRFRLHGPDGQDTIDGWRDLALVLKAAGNIDSAEESMRRALNGSQKNLGFEHVRTRQILDHLCDILDAQGKAQAAKDLRQECRKEIVTTAEKISTPREKGPLVVFILSAYILPDYRGLGFGKSLIDHWKALAREASAHSLQLLAAPASRSISFFSEKCGMSKVCERTLRNRSAVYMFLQCSL